MVFLIRLLVGLCFLVLTLIFISSFESISYNTEMHVHYGNSSVVQWLGLHAFIAVACVQSLVGELRSHKPASVAKKKKKKDYC